MAASPRTKLERRPMRLITGLLAAATLLSACAAESPRGPTPTVTPMAAAPAAAALPPKYLLVPDFRQCLAEQQLSSYTAWCLPSSRPDLCPADSWGRLNALTGIDKLPACPNPKPSESPP
jgi:hypothetical protein